jgi:hypothetical protein
MASYTNPKTRSDIFMIYRTVYVILYTVFHCLSPLARKYLNMYTLQRPRHWTQDKPALSLEQTTEGDSACSQQTRYLIRSDREPKGENVETRTVRCKVTWTEVI